MHVQNLMNSLWDIRIFLDLVPKESPCTSCHAHGVCGGQSGLLVLALVNYLFSDMLPLETCSFGTPQDVSLYPSSPTVARVNYVRIWWIPLNMYIWRECKYINEADVIMSLPWSMLICFKFISYSESTLFSTRIPCVRQETICYV